MLQAPTAHGWQTIHLIDNAEGKGTHVHRYRGMHKLPAETFHQGAAHEGIPAACAYLREHAHDILETWHDH